MRSVYDRLSPFIKKNKPKTTGVAIVVFSVGMGLLFFSCKNKPENAPYSAQQYQTYCGSCHLAPDPINIPKNIWENSVLPEMAARMGYRYNDYDPYKNKSPEEQLGIKRSNKYPEQPILDSIAWHRVHDYIISLAPTTIPIDDKRNHRNKDLSQFSIKTVVLPKTMTPTITGLQFDTIANLFNIADTKGNLYHWPASPTKTTPKQFSSPITSIFQRYDNVYITEIGLLNPNETPKGLITKTSFGITDTIVTKLHRPVFTEILDLNNDGVDELLICEFGNLTGQLTILEKKASGYIKRLLHNQAGSIKFEIADMDQDGKKDIVTLFSQGNEGVIIFYQKDNLQFSNTQVIALPPEYGSSWFELIDYNKDGHLDIILTNGDNADYSTFPKPYHGLRLFLNNGFNSFEQKWFYPIYGATRVLSHDYDLDGDIDFAISALFNDTGNSSNEGFIYLENLNAEQLEFQSYTSKGNFNDGWLNMIKGDYDDDGDIDIMIGGFNVNGLRTKRSFFKPNKPEPSKLILLENRQNDSRARQNR